MMAHAETAEKWPAGTDQLDDLYRRYNARVTRTAYLILGNWQQAEDVAQEVWTFIAGRQDAYVEQRGSWSAWLQRITVNRCLNLRRRLARWLPGGLAQLSQRQQQDKAHPPLEEVLRREERWRIWSAIQKLPIKLRSAVVLRYYNNLSYEEIADILECPIGTVRSRLHTAHRRLCIELREDQ